MSNTYKVVEMLGPRPVAVEIKHGENMTGREIVAVLEGVLDNSDWCKELRVRCASRRVDGSNYDIVISVDLLEVDIGFGLADEPMMQVSMATPKDLDHEVLNEIRRRRGQPLTEPFGDDFDCVLTYSIDLERDANKAWSALIIAMLAGASSIGGIRGKPVRLRVAHDGALSIGHATIDAWFCTRDCPPSLRGWIASQPSLQ